MDRDSFAELVHEIGFAVFRVAGTVEFAELRKELERAALELVSNVDNGAMDKLERLVRLSAAIEEIG
ncbi:MAG: hypothetical protein Q8P99_01940, partial [bacterium]|nr:hypothetical protein [bacterium]